MANKPAEALKDSVVRVKDQMAKTDSELQSLQNLKQQWGRQLLELIGAGSIAPIEVMKSTILPPSPMGEMSKRDWVDKITQEIDKDLSIGEIVVEMMKRDFKCESPETLGNTLYTEAVAGLVQDRILMPVGEKGKTKYRRAERDNRR